MVKAAKPNVLDLRGKHHVTQRALAHVCNYVKQNGLEDMGTSARTMLRNRNAISKRMTPFGTLIQHRDLITKKGGTIKIPFVHPAAMLWVCCKDSEEFKSVLSSCLTGEKPRLRIVQYSDEVTPGRELVAYNDKKIWVVYWAILEFGPAALSNEDAWFTGTVIRSHMVRNKIAGGLGQVFKVFNKMFFGDGCDFRKGIQMNVPHPHSPPESPLSKVTTILSATLEMLVQDNEAHQYTFDWMGAGSVKCCPKCWNAVSKNCNMVHDPTGATVPVFETELRHFRPMTGSLFRQIQNKLKRVGPHLGKTALKQLQADLGFKYNPHSWVQDEDLDADPVRLVSFDVQHCWCQGGVWEIELVAGMECLAKHGHGTRQLHAYMQRFVWPKAYANGRDLCKGAVQDRATPKDIKPTGSASEFLSAGPVIRKWLEDVVQPRGVCAAQVTSLLRCIDVMDLLCQVNTGRVTPAMLADAITRHYVAHVAAYGHTLFVPKHHYMLHMPDQLARFKMLVQCFVHERKHKIVKRWAVPLCSSRDNNLSLLEECTLAHLRALDDPLLKPCLLEVVKANPQGVDELQRSGVAAAESALTGRTARVSGRSVTVGDACLYYDSIVENNDRVGLIRFFASIGGRILVGVSPWQLKEEHGNCKKMWCKGAVSTIIPHEHLQQAVIYSPPTTGNIATVIMPISV